MIVITPIILIVIIVIPVALNVSVAERTEDRFYYSC